MTPTLKQLWLTVRQLQNDMQHAKNQINEERSLRCNLQQLLIGHLESSAALAAASGTIAAVQQQSSSASVGGGASAAGASSSAIVSGSSSGANLC